MERKTVKRPDSRLLSAIPYLHRGGVVADVGTDHAYLPILLVSEKISRSAVACDINEGPLQRAKEHIEAANLQGKIQTLLTDGLHGVESYHPDDILIFGMGGELIVKILNEAPWVKKTSISLVLQPMSRAEILRAWLTENGFSIRGETLSREEQYYQTIHAVWNGKKEIYSESELLLGKFLPENELSRGFLKQKIGVFEKILAGKKASSGADTAYEERILADLAKRLLKAEANEI